MTVATCTPPSSRRRMLQRTPGLSIVGLGCSSFSTFFDSDDDKEESPNVTCQLGVKDLNPTHPRVQEWIATIRFAIVEAGITLLDTAPWYGHGTSEVVVGFALTELLLSQSSPPSTTGVSTDVTNGVVVDDRVIVDRSSLTINTKVGRYEADPSQQFDFTAAATLKSVQRSLVRLNIDSIDCLQLHDPEFAPNLEILLAETIPAMLQAQSNGWCKRLGMTGYPLAVQHQIIVQSIEVFGRNVWDQALVYSHFNLHDTSLLLEESSSRQFAAVDRTSSSTSTDSESCGSSSSFADFCEAHDMLLLTAAPLSMGLLTQEGPPLWHPASDELKLACRNAAQVCFNEKVDLATLALLFALSHPRIPCTILGMENVQQVQIVHNLAARVAEASSKLEQETTTAHSDSSQQAQQQQHDAILEQILTVPEKEVYRILRDSQNGPFAQVLQNGNYQWDGVQGARNFWKQLGVEQEPWQQR